MENTVYAICMFTAGALGAFLGISLVETNASVDIAFAGVNFFISHTPLQGTVAIVFALVAMALVLKPVQLGLDLHHQLRYPAPGAISYRVIATSTMNVLKASIAVCIVVAIASLSAGAFVLAGSVYRWSIGLAALVAVFGIVTAASAVASAYLAIIEIPTKSR